MESGRGPGLIGTLLATMVLAIFVMFYMFAFDDRLQGNDHSIGGVIRSQENELSILRGDVGLARETYAHAATAQADLKHLMPQNRERQQRIASLKIAATEASSANERLTRNAASQRAAYVKFIRNDGKGKILDSLTTQSGRTYTSAMIKEVNAVGSDFRMEDGPKRIPFEELRGSHRAQTPLKVTVDLNVLLDVPKGLSICHGFSKS